MFPFDLTNWMMVFVRVSALLAVFPIFSMPGIPVQVRLGLGALVSFLISPVLAPIAHVPDSFLGIAGVMMIEVGVGLLLGFISRILFYILEFAGNLIASETGLNIGATLNPMNA